MYDRLSHVQLSWRNTLIFLGVLLAVCLVGLGLINLRKGALAAEERALSEEQMRLRSTLQALSEEYDAIGTREDIERRARRDYNFMKQGEVRYVVDNPDLLPNYTLAEHAALTDESQRYMNGR